jgi:hypothetical protein
VRTSKSLGKHQYVAVRNGDESQVNVNDIENMSLIMEEEIA